MPSHSARLLACAALLLAGGSCDSPTAFLDSAAKVGDAAETTMRIAAEAEVRLDELLSDAVTADAYLDTRDVEAAVLGIEGVRAAEANATGTAVRIRQRDGAWLNLALARRTDGRLFIDPRAAASTAARARSVAPGGPPAAATFPTGTRALILAPFQREFQENLEALARPLRFAGFEVDIYADEEAGLERFRSSFLAQYDVVYVSSHGAADVVSRDGETAATMIVTGTRAGRDADVALRGADRGEYALLGQFATGDGVFYGVSGEWIEQTEGSFEESFFYLNAPESTYAAGEPGSLTAALHRMGAGGVVGWREAIDRVMAEAAALRVISSLSRGRSLQQATSDVRTDLAFLLYIRYLRLRLTGESEPVVQVDRLERTQGAADTYHLYDPDRVVGDAVVLPPSGPAGTQVTVEVRVRAEYRDIVTRVDLEILSTGERLQFTQVDEELWRVGNLVAPPAPSGVYPRVETFFYTLRRADLAQLDRGSVTFTITGPAASAQRTSGLWSRAP